MPDLSIFQSIFVTLFLPYALVLAAPGPNLLVVMWAGLASPRRVAPIFAALGVAFGASLAAAIAAVGTSLIPAPSGGTLSYVSTPVFAAFLMRMAIGLVNGSAMIGMRPAKGSVTDVRRTFLVGLFTASLNPMTLPFFLGVFLTNPDIRTMHSGTLACATIFAMAAAWFCGLGMLFSTPSLRRLPATISGRGFRYALAAGLAGYAGLAVWRIAAG